MTRLYTTACLARVQSQRITGAPFGVGTLARHLRGIVADPRASSDTLLILADALRADATAHVTLPGAHRAALHTWADTLAELAPTRATPIEDAACPPTS
jgi:hypothetical protein